MITTKEVDNILKTHIKSASVNIEENMIYGKLIPKNGNEYRFIKPVTYIKNRFNKNDILINNPDTSKIMIRKMFLRVMVINYIRDLNIKL